MAGRVAHNLSQSRKSMVSLAKLLPVTTVVFGLLRALQSGAQSQPQEPAAASLVYDVASIKPVKSGSFMVTQLLYVLPPIANRGQTVPRRVSPTNGRRTET